MYQPPPPPPPTTGEPRWERPRQKNETAREARLAGVTTSRHVVYPPPARRWCHHTRIKSHPTAQHSTPHLVLVVDRVVDQRPERSPSRTSRRRHVLDDRLVVCSSGGGGPTATQDGHENGSGSSASITSHGAGGAWRAMHNVCPAEQGIFFSRPFSRQKNTRPLYGQRLTGFCNHSRFACGILLPAASLHHRSSSPPRGCFLGTLYMPYQAANSKRK